VETVKLEAVPEIANLYRKLRFIDEYDSLRFRLTSKRNVALQSGSTETVEAERIADIAGFDAKYFGANRAKVLKKLSEEYPQLCFVSHVGANIAGYIMCRKAETGYKLGPWVCDPKYPHIATALLAKCVERTGQNSGIFVGVPCSEPVCY
jgi:hypothetical protein